MKINIFRFSFVVSIALALVCTAFGQNGVTRFTGGIGGSKVEMDIQRDGTTISGTYYYRKSGSSNKLKLNGEISADGTFTMQESDATGKETGAFKGKWTESANESGALLEGDWFKPGQTADGLGFYAIEQMVNFSSTKITTREFSESIKAKKADIAAAYPELSGNAKAVGFNNLAKKTVMDALAAFKKDMAGLTVADIRQMGDGMRNYIEVSFNVEYADEDLISINFSEDTFTGGAHGNRGTTTLTYDLKAGREVKLADLFKPGAKYLSTIAAYALKDLKGRKDPESGENRGLAQDIFEDGAKPTVGNYSNWNVTKKGLLLTFPQYQVASYADGPQTVIVPYSALRAIVRPNGALSKSMK